MLPAPWALLLLSAEAASCGARLHKSLDRVTVDSACPPAGSINSACQIFSLLCWAHSVAEQCINIHGDQSRASGGRVWCGGVCVERERDRKREREGRDVQTQLSRLSSSSQPPSADSNKRALHVSLCDVSALRVQAHAVDLGLNRPRC